MAEARDAGRVQETTQVLEAQQVRAAAPAVHLQLMKSSNAGAGHQANREQAAVCNDRCVRPRALPARAPFPPARPVALQRA